MRTYKPNSNYQYAKAENTSLSSFLVSYKNALDHKIEDERKNLSLFESDLKNALKTANDSEAKKIRNTIKRIQIAIDQTVSFKTVPMPIKTVGLIYSSIESLTLSKFVSEMDSYCKGYLLLKKLDLLKVDTKETVNA